jgi:dTDP-4-dehydrorhamnose reductase
MRVAVTGTTGRVGAALARHLSDRHQVIALPRRECELTVASALARALDRLACEVLINPAAITSLEACEDDPALAMRVNAEAPAEMAEWAARRGVRLYHFSTDYVFAGETPELRREGEIPAPLNVYGLSKLAGEQAVLAHPENGVIRVSWVFGPEKPSFIDQIFDAALAGRPLEAIADKFSLPLLTTDLAAWMHSILETETTGILHACHSGEATSWHGMATAVAEEMAACGVIRTIPPVTPLKLDGVAAFRAARPRFTAMDHSRLAKVTGTPPRPWREAVAGYVRDRCALL